MNTKFRQTIPDALIAFILLIVPMVFFYQQTIGGQTLLPTENLFQYEPYHSMAAEYGVEQPHNMLYSDLILENIEWRQFISRQVADGQIPLWQPNILVGSPFIAAGQGLTLYPFSVLFLILPLVSAYGWFTVLQLWMAALSMYVFARVLGIGRPGALIAALAYQLSGYFMGSVVFPMILAGAAWLPLLLAMIELVIRQAPVMGRPSSLPWAMIGAGALGMVALAGHVEVLYFTLLVMGFYAAWRLIAEAIGTQHTTSWQEKARWLAVRAAWLLALVVVGLALAAVQLIPSYELASRSFREGAVTYEQVIDWAYPSRHALAFLMPNFYGSPTHHSIFDVFKWAWVSVSTNANGDAIATTEWGIKNYVEGSAYLGSLPMLLALIATVDWVWSRIFRRGTNYRAPTLTSPLPFAVLAILSLSFVFGTPAYKLLYYGLPFINQSHSPFRWVWPMTLCVAVLAGFGVDYLTPRKDQHIVPPIARIARWIGWTGIGAGGLTVIGLIVARLFYSRFDGLIERVFTGIANASNAFPTAQVFFSYQAANALLMAIMLILSGVVLLLTRTGARYIVPLRRHISVWQPLAVLVIIADLLIPVIGLHPASDARLLDIVPPSIAWLKERQAANPHEPFRVMAYQAPGTTKTLNANIAWLHGLEDAGGYDSLIPGQYADYTKVIMPQGMLPYNRISPLDANHPDALDSPLLDLLGVRYVISEVAIDNPRWSLAYQDDAVQIYENADATPRAFTLPATSTVISAADNPSEGFALLAQQYDYRHYVVVNHQNTPFDFPPDEPAIQGTPQPAAITDYTANEIKVNAQVEDTSWLIVTNSYFPGWRAWARPIGTEEDQEKEVPVYLVNGNFQGVLLEPGDWTVRLKFSSDSFKFGGLASLLVGMAMLFGLGVWGWRYLYREGGEGDGIGVKRVAKNTIAPIVLNLFNKVILFVLTFAGNRILGPAGVGEYAYVVVIWSWFDILTNFGLNTFLVREVARRKDEANKYVVNTTLMRLGLAALGIPMMIGFVAVRQAFVSPPMSSAGLWTLGLLYAGLFFSSIGYGLTALFYAYEKAEVPAAVQTISAFLTTMLGVGALFLGWGIIGLATVSLVVNTISLAIQGTLALRLFRPRWDFDWSLIKAALRESFPLMLNSLLATLFFKIALILLEAIKGVVVVGWYRVVYTWVDMIGVVPSLFTLSLFPVMSRQGADDQAGLKKAYILALKLMTILSIPTAIFTTLLAPFLIDVLAGARFLPHGAIALQIFIWGMIIGWMNSVTQYVIIAVNRQRRLIVAFLVVTIFNVVANLVTIPRYSYPATAVIAILSELVLWAMFYLIILRELGPINWTKILWRLATAGLVTSVVTFLLASWSRWPALAVGVLVYASMLLLLRPFDANETRALAGLLPEKVRDRLIPQVAEG
ncbi:MAG: oligosaccharide flippase family protein [Anaerolineae bacterium]|nr:oligosaccharide flippase family protein [Anaerolineae bacterium]